ncbi:MAG: hypothetical protein H0S82_06405, partial [Anaerolineaceae bacterium]|nr:hypothetical protein [Anaerolineaceae bacterium]
TTLFLGFVVDDDELTIGYWAGLEGDTVEIFFDDNNSGALYEEGENKVTIFPVAPWIIDGYMLEDGSSSSSDDTADGGLNNGVGRVTRQGDFNHFELSYPLCSGDSHDFCLTPGSVFGLKIQYDDLHYDGGVVPEGASRYPDSELDDLVTIELLTIIESFLPLILR